MGGRMEETKIESKTYCHVKLPILPKIFGWMGNLTYYIQRQNNYISHVLRKSWTSYLNTKNKKEIYYIWWLWRYLGIYYQTSCQRR